jgi:hypothetical protein
VAIWPKGVKKGSKRGPKGVQKGVQKGVKNTATPGKGSQKGGHLDAEKGSVGGSKWPKGLKRTQKGGSFLGSILGPQEPFLGHMAKWGSQVPSNRHVNRGSKRGPKRGSKRAYLGVCAHLGHPQKGSYFSGGLGQKRPFLGQKGVKKGVFWTPFWAPFGPFGPLGAQSDRKSACK